MKLKHMNSLFTNQKTGLLFDIRSCLGKDSAVSGTMIFFKGCPLECKWCSYPEGIAPYPEIIYRDRECKKDYSCIKACRKGAIHADRLSGYIIVERKKCRRCRNFNCVTACNNNALCVSGFYLSVGQLMEKIQKDKECDGLRGGIIMSGGEPMYQPEFAIEILKQCSSCNIHTTMETCGHAPWKYYERAINYVDLIFYDIKHMNAEAHRQRIGPSNELILENASKIAEKCKQRMVFRVPVVPGFNDSVENISDTAEFIKKTSRNEVNIVPIHHRGLLKYQLLGMDYDYKNIKPPVKSKLKELKEIFNSYSIKCDIEDYDRI